MNLSRVLSSVLLVVVFAVAAMFAITKYSDAQETACPAGTTLSADGTQCLSEAVNDNVVTTTSCIQGVLSDDGTTCIVPRLDADPNPAETSPSAAPLPAPVPIFTG